MGEEHKSKRPQVAAEEDPSSELNILRREVRQLQAAVRDAALQIASQQDELISLRQALATAETEVDEGISREGHLRMQLELQKLKKERVESIMSAAEGLVVALRDMALESPETGPTRPEPLDSVDSEYVGRYDGAHLRQNSHDLDVVLSRISDNVDSPSSRSDALPTPAMAIPVDPASESPTFSSSPLKDLGEHESIGDTTPPTDQPRGVSRECHTGELDIDRSVKSSKEVPISALRLAQRHSMPQIPSRVAPQGSVTRPASTLLRSAFGKGSATNANQASAIRSSNAQAGEPLPSVVESLANHDDLIRRPGASSLPGRIHSAVSDSHSGEVYCVTSSVDGAWVASGGDDKLVKVYSGSGAPSATISETSRAVTALAFHPDLGPQGSEGHMIYAGSADGTVRCFRRHARRRTKWTLGSVFPIHTHAVRKVLFTDSHGLSASSNLILTCSTDRTIKLSDIENGRRPFAATAPSATFDVDCFGSNGSGVIVSGHKDGGIRLWSAKDQTASVGGAKVHSKGVISVNCLGDGYSVVSLGRDNAIRLCDIRMALKAVRVMDGDLETVSDWHRASVNGRIIACGMGRSGHLGMWDVDSGKLVRRASSHFSDSHADVLDMVARKIRNPGSVVVPHWTVSGQLVCAHRTRQISFWQST